MVLPPGHPEDLVPEGPWALLTDMPPLTLGRLDATQTVITTAAIAVTGTVTPRPRSGSGAQSLTLAAGPAHLRGPAGPDRPRADPHLRPSATGDIELDRVEGVHGPRTWTWS